MVTHTQHKRVRGLFCCLCACEPLDQCTSVYMCLYVCDYRLCSAGVRTFSWPIVPFATHHWIIACGCMNSCVYVYVCSYVYALGLCTIL